MGRYTSTATTKLNPNLTNPNSKTPIFHYCCINDTPIDTGNKYTAVISGVLYANSTDELLY